MKVYDLPVVLDVGAAETLKTFLLRIRKNPKPLDDDVAALVDLVRLEDTCDLPVRASRIFLSKSVPNTKMNKPCNELKIANTIWIPRLFGVVMVPTPSPQVVPKKGVRMARHLAMTTKAFLSSG